MCVLLFFFLHAGGRMIFADLKFPFDTVFVIYVECCILLMCGCLVIFAWQN